MKNEKEIRRAMNKLYEINSTNPNTFMTYDDKGKHKATIEDLMACNLTVLHSLANSLGMDGLYINSYFGSKNIKKTPDQNPVSKKDLHGYMKITADTVIKEIIKRLKD